MKMFIKNLSDEKVLQLMTDSKSNKIKKFCWLAMIILSFTGLVFYIYEIYVKWNISPDIGLTVKKVPSYGIPMPAITFCGALFPEQIQIECPAIDYITRVAYGEKLKALTSEEQNYLAMTLHTCGPYKSAPTAINLCRNRTETNILKLLKEAQFQAHFRNCDFRDVELGSCEKLFSRSMTDYGLCHTFNIQGFNELFNRDEISEDFDIFKRHTISKFPDYESPLYNVPADDDFDEVNWSLTSGYNTTDDEVLPIRALKRNKVGVTHFISMEGARNSNLWFCRLMGRGYKIFIHLPNEIPTFLHKKQFVEFNSDRTFLISAKVYKTSPDLKRYSPEMRGCYFEGERQLKFFKSYTKTLCDFECITNYTLQQCGCVKFSMPRSPDTPVCDLDKVECYNHAMITWPHVSNEDGLNDAAASCSCYETCTSIDYSIDLHKSNVYSAAPSAGRTYSYFNFEFSSHAIEEHTNYIGYTFQNFVADCGGLIGLFLGFSLLSVFEVVFRSLNYCSKIMKKAPLQRSCFSDEQKN